MKKMICILLVISMLTLVFAFDMSASYYISGSVEGDIPFHGGVCYDSGTGSKANAWSQHTGAYNSIQLEYYNTGQEWFDHGISFGEIADVYSSVVSGTAQQNYDYFNYYGWANYVRK